MMMLQEQQQHQQSLKVHNKWDTIRITKENDLNVNLTHLQKSYNKCI